MPRCAMQSTPFVLTKKKNEYRLGTYLHIACLSACVCVCCVLESALTHTYTCVCAQRDAGGDFFFYGNSWWLNLCFIQQRATLSTRVACAAVCLSPSRSATIYVSSYYSTDPQLHGTDEPQIKKNASARSSMRKKCYKHYCILLHMSTSFSTRVACTAACLSTAISTATYVSSYYPYSADAYIHVYVCVCVCV